MTRLNPFAISGLLIAASHLPLFLFLVIKIKSKITRIYSMHIFSIFVWGAGAFLVGINTNPALINIIWKFAYSGVICIPVFFYHVILLMTKERTGFMVFFAYLQAGCFLILLLTNHLIFLPRYVFNSFYWYLGTPAFFCSSFFWFIIVVAAHLKLICYYKKCYPEQKRQILALVTAAFIGFLGGGLSFLISFGIDLYPYGNFLIPIHSLIIAYTIFKHQLLGINVAIEKGVVYSILLLLISLFYLVIVLFCEKVIQGILGYQSTFISIASAFFIGVLFFPLRNWIQRIADKTIFQKTPGEIMQENVLLHREVAQAEKMKAVATFATGMAHEIKNPLTAVKTFSEHLPDKLDDKKFLEKFSRIVGGEVSRIDDLVNQLLDFAKPSPLHLKNTDLGKLIRDTLEFLNSKFIQHKITVINHPKDNRKIHVNIDPNQIKQALLNIFLNSIEAMPGGGFLTVSTSLRSSVSSSVLICVQDTGQGIAKKDLPRIFDPFFSKKDHGTGLGLSITHGIITEHGGTVKVESTPGKGTKFTIELPVNTINN